MIYKVIIKINFKLKFNVLPLCFNPVYYFIKSGEIFVIQISLNSNHSVLNIPGQCLKVEFFNLLKVIELFVRMPIKTIRNETIVDEPISNSDIILLKESPRLLVATEHELQNFLVLNIHHHI
jgi:hypothetical protein